MLLCVFFLSGRGSELSAAGARGKSSASGRWQGIGAGGGGCSRASAAGLAPHRLPDGFPASGGLTGPSGSFPGAQPRKRKAAGGRLGPAPPSAGLRQPAPGCSAGRRDPPSRLTWLGRLGRRRLGHGCGRRGEPSAGSRRRRRRRKARTGSGRRKEGGGAGGRRRWACAAPVPCAAPPSGGRVVPCAATPCAPRPRPSGLAPVAPAAVGGGWSGASRGGRREVRGAPCPLRDGGSVPCGSAAGGAVGAGRSAAVCRRLFAGGAAPGQRRGVSCVSPPGGFGARSVVTEGKRGVAAGAAALSPRAVRNRARATAWGSRSESVFCLKVLSRGGYANVGVPCYNTGDKRAFLLGATRYSGGGRVDSFFSWWWFFLMRWD